MGLCYKYKGDIYYKQIFNNTLTKKYVAGIFHVIGIRKFRPAKKCYHFKKEREYREKGTS